jgi:hypothetical protein
MQVQCIASQSQFLITGNPPCPASLEVIQTVHRISQTGNDSAVEQLIRSDFDAPPAAGKVPSSPDAK